jgi:pimeloyl-ACP methyl ester carboxylesterase
MSHPTLVFVHGAFHGPWVWKLLRAELAEFPVVAVDLPSSGDDPLSLGGFSDDVAAIRDAVNAVDGSVVVVAHSYGGAPTTQAACGLAQVIGVTYVAANVPAIGQTAASFLEEAGDSAWWLDIHGDQGYMNALRPEEALYNDVTPAAARTYIAALRHQSLSSGLEALTDAVWQHIPTSYVVCDHDRAMPAAIQEAMARRTGRVHHLTSGHSPFVSRPSELADLIRADVVSFTSVSEGLARRIDGKTR